jgi:class 3 adenylate cyclase/TolB-like protein
VALDRAERKLTTILAADIAGYSRLMGADEEGTLARLKKLRRELIDPKIKEHHGHIVKTTGDGILIEFSSVVEAARCAVAVQQGTAARNAEVPKEQRIAFRVGINIGDIIIEHGDIYGDGVNVAARLEGLAEPGGVCISGMVYEHVRDKLPYAFVDLGEQQVKNIARPIRVYALGTEAIAGLPSASPAERKAPSASGLAAWRGWVTKTFSRLIGSPQRVGLLVAVLALVGIGTWFSVDHFGAAKHETASQPRGPTLAVLPFDNLSGDPSQEFFSEGISDELITALSRFNQLHVLARNTTFAYKGKALDVQELGRRLNAQYVIEGSVRRGPDQISVTAQLIDAQTGTHVWAQTYERPTGPASLLAIQDEIALLVGAAVGDIRTGAIAKAELERTRTKPASELSSYECVLQGYEASGAQSAAEPMRRARACLESTVKRDPTYAEAWAILTRVLSIQRTWGTGLDNTDKGADLVPRMMETANHAVQLAPESAAAHFALFFAYSATCQRERMRIEADRTLALNPDDANALGSLGSFLGYAGDWDYGRQLAEKAIVLAGPAAPSWWWWVVAKDHYRKGEYAEALDIFRRSYAEQNWLDHLHLVYTLPYVGKTDEAQAQIPILLKLKPDISVHEADRLYTLWCFDEDFRDRMNKALRLAGLRETE